MNDKTQPDDKDIASLFDVDTRQPDNAVDNAIRQMAADAVANDQIESAGNNRSTISRHRFSLIPMVATAAVALLAVGIVPLMLEAPQQSIPTAITESEISADSTLDITSSEISTDSTTGVADRLAAKKSTVESAIGVASGMAEQNSSAPAAKMSRSVAQSNEVVVTDNAGASPVAEALELSTMSSMQAESELAEFATDESELADSAGFANRQMVARAKKLRQSESSSLTQAAQLSPEKWIDQINTLFDKGDIDAAKKQLVKFRAQFKHSEFEKHLRSGLTQQ